MNETLENIQDNSGSTSETEVEPLEPPMDLQKSKPKRIQSAAQKANTEKMRLALKAKHEASKKAKEEFALEKQAKAEARIVKKAESIKKRTAKELKIIEDIPSESSDEEVDIPLPPVKKRIKKKNLPPPPSDSSDDDDYEEESEPVRRPYVPKEDWKPVQRYVPARPTIRYV